VPVTIWTGKYLYLQVLFLLCYKNIKSKNIA